MTKIQIFKNIAYETEQILVIKKICEKIVKSFYTTRLKNKLLVNKYLVVFFILLFATWLNKVKLVIQKLFIFIIYTQW